MTIPTEFRMIESNDSVPFTWSIWAIGSILINLPMQKSMLVLFLIKHLNAPFDMPTAMTVSLSPQVLFEPLVKSIFL